MTLSRLVLAVLAPVLALAMAPSSSRSAASFTVNSTLDAVDANPGDGICADATGACTLRAAVMEANALPGKDAITLGPGRYDLSIRGADEDAAASGDLDITDSVEIRGAGTEQTVIDGNPPGVLPLLDRILDVGPEATVLVSRLAIQHGVGDYGGGILNVGSLTLTDVAVRENFASEGGGVFNGGVLTLDNAVLRDNEAMFGGGISNIGTMTINESAFIHNHWSGSEGVGGGILHKAGTMTLNHVDLRDNFAFFGGAIYNGSTATLDKVTVQNNSSAFGPGGGILNTYNMTLANSTVSDNESSGIFNESDGVLTATNSTISDNQGAGIVTLHTADSTLSNVTVSGNTRAGIFTDNAPLPNQTLFPTVTVINSIIAGNGDADCADTNPGLESTISTGHNLSSDDTCPFTATGDVQNTDPMLGPLADNGGLTLTHALLPGSSAIDAGDDAACPATDQRGVARPIDGNSDGVAVCDIGAFEAAVGTTPPAPSPSPSPPPSPTATPAATAAAPGSLPAALPRTGGHPLPAESSPAAALPLGAWAVGAGSLAAALGWRRIPRS